MIVGWGKLRVLIWSALIPACGTAQLNEAASACPSPEVVLQRYVDAVGGKAVYDIQSRAMTARESEGDRATEHYVYKFKWKASNKVTARFTPYLLNLLPVSYPNGTFIFDGEAWSDVFRQDIAKRGTRPRVAAHTHEGFIQIPRIPYC